MEIEGDTYVLQHITFSVPDTYEIHLKDTLAFKAVARNISFGKLHEFMDRDANKLLEFKHTRGIIPTYEISQHGERILTITQPFPYQSRLEGEGKAGKYSADVDELIEKNKGALHKGVGSWKILDGDFVKRAVMRIGDKFNSSYTVVVDSTSDVPLVLSLCVILSETIGFGPSPPHL
jgi:uncharacterized protein YxjI